MNEYCETHFTFAAIGRVISCYRDKFGVPRQPGLAPASKGTIQLLPPYNQADIIRGLEDHSHIWVQFIFHHCLRDQWKPTVRPPRLGGNERVGVLATRSTFRPNPLGLSVVKLESTEIQGGEVLIHISGLDLVDGTPVVDIKPYIPYVDNVDTATSIMAAEAPPVKAVIWSAQAKQDLLQYEAQYGPLRELAEQVLQQDPRPAYRQNKTDSKRYGIRLYQADIRFSAQQHQNSIVLQVEAVVL